MQYMHIPTQQQDVGMRLAPVPHLLEATAAIPAAPCTLLTLIVDQVLNPPDLLSRQIYVVLIHQVLKQAGAHVLMFPATRIMVMFGEALGERASHLGLCASSRWTLALLWQLITA